MVWARRAARTKKSSRIQTASPSSCLPNWIARSRLGCVATLHACHKYSEKKARQSNDMRPQKIDTQDSKQNTLCANLQNCNGPDVLNLTAPKNALNIGRVTSELNQSTINPQLTIRLALWWLLFRTGYPNVSPISEAFVAMSFVERRHTSKARRLESLVEPDERDIGTETPGAVRALLRWRRIETHDDLGILLGAHWGS